jgi:hypothetical protein
LEKIKEILTESDKESIIQQIRQYKTFEMDTENKLKTSIKKSKDEIEKTRKPQGKYNKIIEKYNKKIIR